MYVFVCVGMSMCACVYIFCTYIYMCLCACKRIVLVCVHVCGCVGVLVSMYIVFVCMCVRVCMYVCICTIHSMYIHVEARRLQVSSLETPVTSLETRSLPEAHLLGWLAREPHGPTPVQGLQALAITPSISPEAP